MFHFGVCSARPLEQVHDDLERGLRREDPGVLRHVLLEDVVLDRALQLVDRHALLLRRGDVEAEQDRRRAVDRHRGGDLVERNPVEQGLHVGQARDRDAALADLALGAGMVGVVAHQRRESRTRPRARSGPARAGTCSARWCPPRVPKPANWRMVHSRPRYIVGWMPRVNGYCTGQARAPPEDRAAGRAGV